MLYYLEKAEKWNLINPTIGFSCLNKLYGRPRYPIFSTYNRLTSIIASYSLYLFIRKYSLISVFEIPIKVIVYLCSKKKMLWIYTRRSIALMKHVKTVWNRTYVQFPRYSMGTKAFPSNSKRAISILNATSRPKPATRIGFWNSIFLKAFLNWNKKGFFHNYFNLRIGVT